MKDSDWKEQLESLLEDVKVIEQSQQEAFENFDQFCEFVAEPAFETLVDEFKKYRIKSRFKRSKKRSIDFQINFQGSRVDHFHYIIRLPKNAIELKLRLQIKARKDKESPLEKREEPFMEDVGPSQLLKLTKEDIIQDVLVHYKNFTYETVASPD